VTYDIERVSEDDHSFVEVSVDTFFLHYSPDFFKSQVRQGVIKGFKIGADVTEAFSEDVRPPLRAVVVQSVSRSPKTNVCVQLTFSDKDHSWEWYLENNNCGDFESTKTQYEYDRQEAA
jgi:hypothetical protein